MPIYKFSEETAEKLTQIRYYLAKINHEEIQPGRYPSYSTEDAVEYLLQRYKGME